MSNYCNCFVIDIMKGCNLKRNFKTSSIEVETFRYINNMLHLSEGNSNTIELTVHLTCYRPLDLLFVILLLSYYCYFHETSYLPFWLFKEISRKMEIA